jgi:hypothetical protein
MDEKVKSKLENQLQSFDKINTILEGRANMVEGNWTLLQIHLSTSDKKQKYCYLV